MQRGDKTRGWFPGRMGLVALALGVLAPFLLHADVIIVGSNHIKAIDTSSGEELNTLMLKEAIWAIAFSADGSTVFVGSSGGKNATKGGVFEVDAATLTVRRQLTTSPVLRLRMAPDGKTLRILEWDVDSSDPKHPVASPYRLVSYDTAARRATGSIELGHKIFDFMVSPDGAIIFTVSLTTDTLQVHDSTGKVTERISVGREPAIEGAGKGLKLSLCSLRRAPDGRVVLLRDGIKQGEVLLVDMKSRKAEAIAIGHGVNIRDAVITAQNVLIIDAVKHLYAIDLTQKKEVASQELEHAITKISLSNDGTHLFLSAPVKAKTTGGCVQVRRADTLELVREIDTPETSPWVLATAPGNRGGE